MRFARIFTFETHTPFPRRSGPAADCFLFVDWNIAPQPALSWSSDAKAAKSSEPRLPLSISSPLDEELVSVRVTHDSLPSPVPQPLRALTPRSLTPEPQVDADSVRGADETISPPALIPPALIASLTPPTREPAGYPFRGRLVDPYFEAYAAAPVHVANPAPRGCP